MELDEHLDDSEPLVRGRTVTEVTRCSWRDRVHGDRVPLAETYEGLLVAGLQGCDDEAQVGSVAESRRHIEGAAQPVERGFACGAEPALGIEIVDGHEAAGAVGVGGDPVVAPKPFGEVFDGVGDEIPMLGELRANITVIEPVGQRLHGCHGTTARDCDVTDWPEAERPAVLLHYSEDPEISVFAPHVPRTNPSEQPAVWTLDPAHAPLYWFPRDCPRAAVWANDDAQRERLADQFVTTASRVQWAPRAWADRIRECTLYEYRFDPGPFVPWPDAEGQWISQSPVSALTVSPVGDLIARQARHGVDLRLVADIARVRDAVVTSGLPFSIVRYGDR